MFASIRHASILFAATAILATIAVAPASAATSGDTRSVTVRHGDIDLKTDAGVATLERRVKVAAKTVCGNADPRDLAANQRINACRTSAMADAHGRIELAIAAARAGTRLARNDDATSIQVAAH